MKKQVQPLEGDDLSSKEILDKSPSNERFLLRKFLNILRNVLDLIIEYKSAIIIIIAWILVSEVANYLNPEESYTLGDLLGSVFMVLLYPIFLLFFNTGFKELNVSQIFLLFIPLVLLISAGFLIIISTEN